MSWQFEPDEDVKHSVDAEQDAMNYVLTFGAYKGQTFGEIMRTQKGRSYLRWLSAQPDTDPEFAAAHAKRNARIATCFAIYERWQAGEAAQPELK